MGRIERLRDFVHEYTEDRVAIETDASFPHYLELLAEKFETTRASILWAMYYAAESLTLEEFNKIVHRGPYLKPNETPKFGLYLFRGSD